MYILVCINCGFRWESGSADWCCCPVCESNDIAPERKIVKEKKRKRVKVSTITRQFYLKSL